MMYTGCPRLLRTDLGTENSMIAIMQPMLRHNSSDSLSGANSHRYGTSTSNQVRHFAMSSLHYVTFRGLKHSGINSENRKWSGG